MLKFAIRKLLIMAITVLLISIAVFYIITLPPGDFLTNYIGRLNAAGETIDPQLIANLREQYGLDEPFFSQYWHWMSNILLHGDFGYSFSWSMPVTKVIEAYIGPTMALSLVTMLFTYLVAIPIGIYSAVHQYSAGDYIFTAIGFFGKAMPNFLTAILFMFIDTAIHGIYQCRTSSWGDIFIPDIIPDGGLRKSGSADEYLRGEDRNRLCGAWTDDRGHWWYGN